MDIITFTNKLPERHLLPQEIAILIKYHAKVTVFVTFTFIDTASICYAVGIEDLPSIRFIIKKDLRTMARLEEKLACKIPESIPNQH